MRDWVRRPPMWLANRQISRLRQRRGPGGVPPACVPLSGALAGVLPTWPPAGCDPFAPPSSRAPPLGGPAAIPPVPEPMRPPPPVSIAPATFEMRFMRLQAEGRFDEMWEMLAEDAQRAWGGREAFIKNMPRLGDDAELLDMQVISVTALQGSTDRMHHPTYPNVAQLCITYRVRQHW